MEDWKVVLLAATFLMSMMFTFTLIISVLDHYNKDRGKFEINGLIVILLWSVFYTLNLIL